MHKIISTTTRNPAIRIIQGAYERFRAPSKVDTTYDARTFDLVLTVEACAFATPHDLWLRFQSLAAAWRQQRGVMSSITDAAMCPAYQSIIGLGEAAVPFIIATLESEGQDPDQWFWALRAITGADPVSPQHRGDYRAMARTWIDWAKTMGYAR